VLTSDLLLPEGVTLTAVITNQINTRTHVKMVRRYRIQVQPQPFGHCWFIERRYSEFLELQKALRALPCLPPLSPKLVVSTLPALADRYLCLDAFLQDLLEHPAAHRHAELHAFLGVGSESFSFGRASLKTRESSVSTSFASRLSYESIDSPSSGQ
jgi:hypothetical protein